MKTIYGYVVWFVATLLVVYSFGLNTASAVFSDAKPVYTNNTMGE